MNEQQSENQRLRGRKDLAPQRCWLCNDLFHPRYRGQETCYDCTVEFRQFRSGSSPRRLIFYGLHHLATRIAVLERALADLKEAKHE